MTTTFGVTDLGLLVPRIQDLLEEFEAELREAFGPTVDLSVESVEGQFTGITAERLAKAWEALEVLGSVLDEGAARGKLLDALCALTGTYRRPPTFSVVGLVLAGDDGTTINGSSLVSNGQPAFQFQTIGDVNIAAVAAWNGSLTYAEGDIVTTGGNVYRAKIDVPDTVAEPTFTERFPPGTSFMPATAPYWLWLGAGDGAAAVNARAVIAGPTFIAAGGIDTIDTPISGLTGVFNPLDVTPGANLQTDEDLAILRLAEIAALGTSPPDALRGRLLRLGEGTATPVTAATIFRNVNDVTDGDGIPPHATEAMVRGGEDQAIRELLWACVSAGSVTHGNVSGTIVDSEGNDQTVKFSRPTELNIYVDIELTKNALLYPLDGDAQVKAAIVAYGAAQATGKDVVASRIVAAAFSVVGVLDVAVLIGTAPGPSSSSTIEVSLRELAVYDTGRITVASTNGVP